MVTSYYGSINVFGRYEVIVRIRFPAEFEFKGGVSIKAGAAGGLGGQGRTLQNPELGRSDGYNSAQYRSGIVTILLPLGEPTNLTVSCTVNPYFKSMGIGADLDARKAQPFLTPRSLTQTQTKRIEPGGVTTIFPFEWTLDPPPCKGKYQVRLTLDSRGQASASVIKKGLRARYWEERRAGDVAEGGLSNTGFTPPTPTVTSQGDRLILEWPVREVPCGWYRIRPLLGIDPKRLPDFSVFPDPIRPQEVVVERETFELLEFKADVVHTPRVRGKGAKDTGPIPDLPGAGGKRPGQPSHPGAVTESEAGEESGQEVHQLPGTRPEKVSLRGTAREEYEPSVHPVEVEPLDMSSKEVLPHAPVDPTIESMRGRPPWTLLDLVVDVSESADAVDAVDFQKVTKPTRRTLGNSD